MLKLSSILTAASFAALIAASGLAHAEGVTLRALMEDVPETQMLDETRQMLAIEPRVLGAIANGRPEHADFAQYLETLAGLKGVRGIRRLLRGEAL